MAKESDAEIRYFRMRSESGDFYYRVDLVKPVGEQVQWLDHGIWVETEFEDFADFLRNTRVFNPGAIAEVAPGEVPEPAPQGRDTVVSEAGDDPPDQAGDVSTTPHTVPATTASSILCDQCKNRQADLLAHFPGIRARPPRWCPDCAGFALSRLVRRGLVVTVTSTTHNVGSVRNGGQATLATTGAALADDDVREPGVADLDWTVELAVRMLRMAKPAGSVFLRALVDEGGTATAARLRELTGATHLNPMTQTLNASMKKVFGRRLAYDDRHLAHPNADPEHPRRVAVHSYSLPPHIVPILDVALRQLGR